jgi:tetratricopeptide (TPR) repeat protein
MEVSGVEHRSSRYAAVFSWFLLLLVAVIVYAPGLSGPFVFDDFAVFGQLGRYGGVVDWESFKAFVLGGVTGPTGRPIAMLSFLVDGNDWPTDSWPFKRTNLALHLVNASILALLVWQILCLTGRKKKPASWIAVVAAGCWLLHPYLVSTTLYAVQRMAQLSTLFVFAGMLGYLQGRVIAEANASRGYLVMTLSLGVFTVLATLSKENGVLLPVLVGVLELTVLAASSLAALDRRWAALFLGMPATLIIAFLAYKAVAQDFFSALPLRDFSAYERLLTQPRVLSEYFANWFIPKLYTTGVFQDHVTVSRSLFSPPATAIHILIHGAVITTAWALRRRQAMLTFAVLFFYAGHLVESTTLNLEIYFEHRNYLPAAFLFLPVVLLIRDKTRTSVFLAISAVFLLTLGSFTRFSAGIWSEYSLIVEASARKAPMSVRAQSEFAKLLFNSGRYEAALLVIDNATARHKGVRQQLLVTKLIFQCKQSVLNDAELQRASPALSKLVFDRRLLGVYEEFVLSVINGDCPDTTLDAVHAFISVFLQNPRNVEPGTQRLSQVQYILGLLDARNGQPQRAVLEFTASLESRPAVSAALNIAAVLAASQYYSESLLFIDKARALLRQGVPEVDGARIHNAADIDRLESKIRDLMNSHKHD